MHFFLGVGATALVLLF